MKRPLLSIVLPTKDRSVFAMRTIQAILSQSFQEYEIIVVNNDSGDETEKMLGSICDPRVRAIRTGGLNMPQNWEIALRVANGVFVTLINDKTLLRPNALEKMLYAILQSQAEFVTWVIGVRSASINDEHEGFVPPKYHSVDNEDVLANALAGRIDLYQRLAPRGTNCIVKGEYLKSLFEKHNTLCRPISPDYSLSVFMLAGCRKSEHIYEVLGDVVSGAPSNTDRMLEKPHGDMGYYASLGMKNEEFFSEVPVKAFLINNVLLNDVLVSLKSLQRKSLSVEPFEYFLMLLSDLVILKRKRMSFLEQKEIVRSAFMRTTTRFKVTFILYAFRRFISGWPNRNSRMRENLSPFLDGLQLLFCAK